jgi:16S rRNA (uracil1498-N3)-methyltransferase
MQIFYQPDILSGVHELSKEESQHCVKVLRHQVGDQIHVVDGRGSLFEVRLTEARAKRCTYTIISHKREPEKPYYIQIAIAPTKNLERLEWFVEKTIEIGIDEISFFFGNYSERKKLKLERIERKAISAMKQSEKFILPRINLHDSFEALTKEIPESFFRFIAHVDKDNKLHLMDAAVAKDKYCVLIGPEGDFSEDELEFAMSHNFTRISLGKSRLRTETAGVVACHTLNLINL